MAGQHEGNTKEFRGLTFAEQARSINASINSLQAAIEHHIKHSPDHAETIGKCPAQIDRLGHRSRDLFADRPEVQPDLASASPAVSDVPRWRVGSPRLADPRRAADFVMEVTEEPQAAGL